MNLLKITKSDLNENNEYVGSTDVQSFEGSIEIEEKLGWVRFSAGIKVTGYIYAKAGSGI